MTTGARTTALALATVALGACTGASSTPTTNVVDSAGVRIVTNLPGSIESAATWSLSTEQVVDIGGGATPDVPLHRVTAVVPLSPIAAPGSRTPAAWTHLLPSTSGSLVALVIGVWGPGLPERGAYRLELASHRIDASGTELATYGPFPGQELYRSPEAGVVPYPFGADTYAASSRGTLVVGTAESPELGFYAADGTLERIARWPDHDRTAAEGPLVSDFNTWLDAQLASRAPGERAMLRQLIGAIPLPERFPAYHGIIGGDTGEVWVGEYPGQLAVRLGLRESSARQRRAEQTSRGRGVRIACHSAARRFNTRTARR